MPTLAPPPRPPRTPTWLKLMLGCGVVLAAIGLAVVGAIGYGFYWAISPGRQVPTAAVVGPRSAGVLQAGDLSSDEGMRDFLRYAFEQVQRRNDARDADLPPFLKEMRRWRQSQTGASLTQWMPYELTASLEPADDVAPARAAVAVNFRQYVRPVRFFMERIARDTQRAQGTGGEGRILGHRGHTILQYEKLAVGFLDGTVVFAADAETVRATFDRADAKPVAVAATRDLDDLRPHWDLSGRTTQAATTLALLVALGLDPNALSRPVPPASSRFGFDVQTSDTARGFVELRYPSADDAAQAAPAIRAGLDAGTLAQRTGTIVTWSAAVAGPVVKVEMKARGLRAAVAHGLEALEHQPAGRTPRPQTGDTESDSDR